jgi:hypothetical protein
MTNKNSIYLSNMWNFGILTLLETHQQLIKINTKHKKTALKLDEIFFLQILEIAIFRQSYLENGKR